MLVLRRRFAFTGLLQYALLSLLYYQPARRTAALQEQLAVNELDELRRVCVQSAR